MLSDAWLEKIDRLVAEKVMDWHGEALFGGREPEMWVDEKNHRMEWIHGYHPTRDGGQAMQVFEKLATTTKLARLEGDEDGYWMWVEPTIYQRDAVDAGADNPRLAICLAALKKADVEVPDAV